MTTETLVPFTQALERYEPLIGLETHVELGTRTKMFCGCITTFGAEPNTQVCPVCLGLPGSLPVVNRMAIEYTIRIGLALNCTIATWCRFARKNYFYPDMPKNFQISQYDEPLCTDGYLDVTVDGQTIRVGIERVHLEEDTGKSLHVGGATGRIHGAEYSLVDYNRAGIPLVEIVTKPIEGTGAAAPEVARAYVTELRDLLRGAGRLRRADGGGLAALRREHLAVAARLGPSGGPGPRPRTSTRCARWSARSGPRSSGRPPCSTRGGRVIQETRHFHEDSGTHHVRPVQGRGPGLPVLPRARPGAGRPAGRLGGADPRHPARGAVQGPGAGCRPSGTCPRRKWTRIVNAGALDLVAQTVAAGASPADARKWWLGELARRANDAGLELADLPITPAQVARIAALVAAGALNDRLARDVIDAVLAGEGDPDQVVAARGLAVVSDEGALNAAIDQAIAANPDVVAKVRDGKVAAAGPLVGAVMRATGGQADAARVRELILARLTP